jgi:hypothetical protein
MEFRLAGFPPIRNTIVDALAVARRLLPGLDRYPQHNVARVLGIPDQVKHRAQEDALITATILTIFTSILKAYECPRLSDLMRPDIFQVLEERRMRIIAGALAAARNVWIKYLSPADNVMTDRIVTPKEIVGLARAQGTRSLIAYCHAERGDRNFRIDRILDLRLMEDRSF